MRPLATYRVQFGGGFGFAAAAALSDYLASLGVSHLYAAPAFKARAGSQHGYDVVDPAAINPELGGEAGFRAMSAALRAAGLSIMQDIVPNHMAYSSENEALMDVLEKGPHSAFRGYFDVDWEHAYENLRGRLLVPFLGSFYAEALERGELKLVYDEKGLSLNYYSLRLPVRMESWRRVFGQDAAGLEEKAGRDSQAVSAYIGTAGLFRDLSARPGEPYPQGQFDHARGMMRALYSSEEQVKAFVDARLAALNGVPGDRASFDELDALVSEQFYRPSYWKVAAEEINYRRFFTINELISLRIEDPDVFRLVHGKALQLAADGCISALRIDHVDGLIDPRRYLDRLREAAGPEIYLAVEKILAPGEPLPSDWRIQGTTGYDFMNCVNGLFCMKDSEKDLTRTYFRFTGSQAKFDGLVCAKKRMIISRHLAGNIDNLANMVKKASANDRYGRDITLYGLRRALVEVMANFPVYRTYITQEAGPTERELGYIRSAVAQARLRLPEFGYEFDFLEAFLTLGVHPSLEDEKRRDIVAFVMAFQQYTAPLMAKGFEDTLLYIYARLTSLNEVGSAPNLFGFTSEEFHSFCAERAVLWPATMNATATHDTKRGEDTRARINVISELPREWAAALRRWARHNQARKRRRPDGSEMPDRNDEYFIYQTLLGSWPSDGKVSPDFIERIKAYAIKAAREAQVNTNWIKPDADYEAAYCAFLDKALSGDPEEDPFLKDFIPFSRKVSFYGAFNSLSQTLLKTTAPGLPDFYQGSELWDLSLVDPDNRRPVDYALRRDLLAGIQTAYAAAPQKLMSELLADLPSGKAKFFLTWRALAARRELREVFESGDYTPLKASGTRKDSVIAFARSLGGRRAMVIAPRFLSGFVPEGKIPLGEVWGDTALELPEDFPQVWRDAVSGAELRASRIPLAQALAAFPCAILIAD